MLSAGLRNGLQHLGNEFYLMANHFSMSLYHPGYSIGLSDITENVSSQMKLFADDCLLYRVIKTEQDSSLLQKDLDALSQWAVIWQMRFNPSKITHSF